MGGDRSTLSADGDQAQTGGGLPGGDYQDLLSGQAVVGPSVDLSARTSLVLLPQ